MANINYGQRGGSSSPVATTTTSGTTKPSDGLSVAADGSLSVKFSTGLKFDNNKALVVDPTQVDATQLLNIAQVASGGYVGAINFGSGLSQFANAQKNQYWQANTAGSIGGLTFAIGDNLICVSNVVGTPATLANSSWQIRANVSAVATSSQLGQVKPTDGLSVDGSGTLIAKLGNGLQMDGSKAITINAAQIDVTTLNKADTLVNGIYKGGLNGSSTLTTLANAVKGNWWNCSAAVTISSTAFAVGDQLWCQTAVTGTPADLTNFTRVPATMATATTTVAGIVQLAGDLAGTSSAPAVAKMGGVAVPASAPTAAGKYHRSDSTSATSWNGIQAGDLPSATSAVQGAVKVGGVIPTTLGTATAGTSVIAAAADHVHARDIANTPTWALANNYSKGDLVVYTDANVYIANGTIAANTAWALGSSGATWQIADGAVATTYVLSSAYQAGELVIYTDKLMYVANSFIAANTTWAIGTTGATWKLVNGEISVPTGTILSGVWLNASLGNLPIPSGYWPMNGTVVSGYSTSPFNGMTMPDTRGKVLANTPSSGATVGSSTGNASFTLVRSNLPNTTVSTSGSFTPTGSLSLDQISFADSYVGTSTFKYDGTGSSANAGTSITVNSTQTRYANPTGSFTGSSGTVTTSFALNGNVTQTAVSLMQPTYYVTQIIKL